MTVYAVVTVFDRSVNGFGRPFFAPSNGAAIRSFLDEVNRSGEDNIMFKHPDDFDLYLVGTFDDANGALVPQVPEILQLGRMAIAK